MWVWGSYALIYSIHTSLSQPSLACCRNDCLLPTLRSAVAKLGGGLALSPTFPPHFFSEPNSILAAVFAPPLPSMKYWIYYWFVKNPHSSSYKGTCTLDNHTNLLIFFFQSKQHFCCWLQITTKVNDHLITKKVVSSTYCSILYFSDQQTCKLQTNKNRIIYLSCNRFSIVLKEISRLLWFFITGNTKAAR